MSAERTLAEALRRAAEALNDAAAAAAEMERRKNRRRRRAALAALLAGNVERFRADIDARVDEYSKHD
jgi:hypothetical protein